MKYCRACGVNGPLDRCHIKTKASGGTWDDWNIIMMCRDCHVKSGQLGWNKFCDEFPEIEHDLMDKGWEFREEFGIMKLRRR